MAEDYVVYKTNSKGRRRTQDEIIAMKMRQYYRKCKCSHTVFLHPKTDRKICTYCGHYVYQNEEIEKQYKREEFKKKLKGMM